MSEDATTGWFDARIVTGAHPAALVPKSDPAAIAVHLDTYGMSGALVSSMASWLHDPVGGNAEASAVAHGLADRGVLACWTAVPPTPGELHSLDALVMQAVTEGVAAFRLYPRSHGYSPVDHAMDELYAALATNGLPLCVDVTEIDWHHLDHLATHFPTLPIILSNLGYRQLRSLWAAVRDHENLYVDLVDFAGHQAIEWLAARGLADRLLFATGLGLRDPGESIVRLAWSGLDDDTVAQIGAGTADRLFGIRRTAMADQLGGRP
ncbi:amidohydrolase family protein [Kribbella turkmenica]|nr:amidohydrolase family protein [Kribbella turkmenica]